MIAHFLHEIFGVSPIADMFTENLKMIHFQKWFPGWTFHAQFDQILSLSQESCKMVIILDTPISLMNSWIVVWMVLEKLI